MKVTTKTPAKIKILALVFIFLLPVLALVVFEFTLISLNYGISDALFLPSGIPGKRRLNDAYVQLFSPYRTSTYKDVDTVVSPLLIDIKKPANSFRIFVLGGSTAEGYPYPAQYSFTNIAGHLLQRAAKDKNIEVVNLGRSAMSSYYVRETAKRIWKYKPDLLVVYAGHNEYYGTVAAGSGGSHASKLIYCTLRKFRFVQLVHNFMRPSAKGQDRQTTLMAMRAQEGLFPQNELRDKEVAWRFLDNLSAVQRASTQRKVPLCIIDPVSNLITMPPFSSEEESSLKPLIFEGLKAFQKSKVEFEAWLGNSSAVEGFIENAHIKYLKAVYHLNQGNGNLSEFSDAKDADAMPFRARESLRSALRMWAEAKAEGVIYIPLQEALIADKGLAVMSDSIFIDHLHFNQAGQRIVAALLARTIAQRFKEIFPKPDEYLFDPKTSVQILPYHPALELQSLMAVKSILSDLPYTAMLINYSEIALSRALSENIIMQDQVIRKHILEGSATDILAEYGNEMIKRQNWIAVLELLDAQIQISPGSVTPIFQKAKFLGQMGNALPEVLDMYYKAYLLSGRRKDVRNELEAFVGRFKLEAELDKLEAEY